MPTLSVKGMHCGNCSNAVTKALQGIEGIKNVSVDLAGAEARWENIDEAHPVDVENIKKAIVSIGFEVE